MDSLKGGRIVNGRITTWIMTACLALAACAGCQGDAPAPPKGSGPGGTLTPDEQKAVDLARDFLAKSGTNWGSPVKVQRQPKGFDTPAGKGEDTYLLTYPTPEDEVKTISWREVFVNTKTGKVAFQLRL